MEAAATVSPTTRFVPRGHPMWQPTPGSVDRACMNLGSGAVDVFNAFNDGTRAAPRIP